MNQSGMNSNMNTNMGSNENMNSNNNLNSSTLVKVTDDSKKKAKPAKEKKSFFSKKKKEDKKAATSAPSPTDGLPTPGIQKRQENAPERPLIKYRYVVINAMGKKEKGTFEAESEAEVRSFLTSQDYEVISITVRPAYDIDINDHAKMKVSDLSFALTHTRSRVKSGIPLVMLLKSWLNKLQNLQVRKLFNDWFMNF